jgi:hypothetical protein
MIRALNGLIMRWSQLWWMFLAAAIASALSFQSLFVIGERFERVTAGYAPFDLQNPLTLATIWEQLPAYTEASLMWYWAFIAADMIFPVFGALPLALVLAWALRTLGTPWATRALASGAALTPFVAALLDWVENGFFVATVALYPQDVTFWATLAVATKSVKVGFLLVSSPAIFGLAGLAALRWLVTRAQRPKRVAG